MRAAADLDVFRVDAAGLQFIDLFQQNKRIDNDARADDAQCVLMQNAGGQ